MLGAANGMIATGLSAIGAHALPATMTAFDKATFALATDFHLFHALALLLTGMLASVRPNTRPFSIAAWLYQVGIIAFSGSLYLRTALGPGSLGFFHWVTPIGGLALIAGWGALILAGYTISQERS
ncbi:MAG: DUF423 domain-containing protein [Alphaproteobacteria bacterium]|nr:DUF423 domain-containing protein [Alphaproteobacteria bacterium]